MIDPILHINTEHAGIWRILNTLEKLNALLFDSDDPPDALVFGAIFDYLESYHERIHHPKEENYLFKRLHERHPGADGLLESLERDHSFADETMANLRAHLGKCLDGVPGARYSMAQSITHLVERQRAHIRKEDRLVIPLVREYFTEEDMAFLAASFSTENPLFGESVLAEFRTLYSTITNYAPAPIGLGLSHPAPPPGKLAELEVVGLTAHYGRIQVLKGIDLTVGRGELVALVGANGAGKTTLLRTVSGVQGASGGSIRYRGRDITRLPAEQRVRMGIAQVPEGRQVFGPMAVEDNLRLGGYTRGKKEVADDLARMFDMFPILREKRREPAGTLSGGQQQMLVIARALMSRPQLLLLDEPSMGLAPLLVDEIFNTIMTLREQGITVFLVEQNAYAALSAADHGYVIETGRIALSGEGDELLNNHRVREAYLGM